MGGDHGGGGEEGGPNGASAVEGGLPMTSLLFSPAGTVSELSQFEWVLRIDAISELFRPFLASILLSVGYVQFKECRYSMNQEA